MDVSINTPGTFDFYLPADEFPECERWGVDRSPLESGIYTPLHDQFWAPATLLTKTSPTFDVIGRDLTLNVCGRVVSVEFTGHTPLSVATAINAALPGYLTAQVMVDPSGAPSVSILTVNVGNKATLRVVGGEAVPYLGFSKTETQGTDVYGARSGDRFTFTDVAARPGWWYRLKLYNTVGQCIWSYPQFQNNPIVTVPTEELIVGRIQMCDVTGRSAMYVNVSIQPVNIPGGMVVSDTVERTTDHRGCAEFRLIRGSRIKLSISGTNMVRTILVPMEGSSFNLLDPTISEDPDALAVQVPKLQIGSRRTL